MTMTTQVAIRLPQRHTLSPQAVMAGAVTSLLAAARKLWRLDRIAFAEPMKQENPWGTKFHLSTEPGQDLPSWTFVHYDPAGPYAPTDLTYTQVRPNALISDHEIAIPACDFMIDYDGAHTQSELHAHAIHLLHRWIHERGGSIWWTMPPEPKWHPFEDQAAWTRLAEKHRWVPVNPTWMQAQ